MCTNQRDVDQCKLKYGSLRSIIITSNIRDNIYLVNVQYLNCIWQCALTKGMLANASSSTKPTRMSVPQFGGWDHKVGNTDYSMVFSRARANKKQNKNDFNRHSIGNEQELIIQKQPEHQPVQKSDHQHDDSVVMIMYEDDSPN
ncbi:hypothetical protein CsSME_00042166 [Camellia sinensis var. sinensis]